MHELPKLLCIHLAGDITHGCIKAYWFYSRSCFQCAVDRGNLQMRLYMIYRHTTEVYVLVCGSFGIFVVVVVVEIAVGATCQLGG